MAYQTHIPGLIVTNNRIDGLMADFSGWKNLEKTINDVLKKLAISESVQMGMRHVRSGVMSKGDFDGWLAELVNLEIRNALGVLRNKAVQKALAVGAHDAAYAVSRRTYKDRLGGNINIAGHRGRLSSRSRVVDPPTGGKSGIRRERSVKARTMQLRQYYGPDRDFILRILEEGRDTFMAKSDGPTGRGSKATWGARGAVAPRSWFQASLRSDLEQAAQQLGHSLQKQVKEWVETKFTE